MDNETLFQRGLLKKKEKLSNKSKSLLRKGGAVGRGRGAKQMKSVASPQMQRLSEYNTNSITQIHLPTFGSSIFIFIKMEALGCDTFRRFLQTVLIDSEEANVDASNAAKPSWNFI